jgi:flagellar biosynthesis/type III secretory pathway chaperone
MLHCLGNSLPKPQDIQVALQENKLLSEEQPNLAPRRSNGTDLVALWEETTHLLNLLQTTAGMEVIEGRRFHVPLPRQMPP